MKKITLISVIVGILISEILLVYAKIWGFLIYTIVAGVILVSMEKDNYMTKGEQILVLLLIIPILRISEFFIDFNILWKSIIFYGLMIALTYIYIAKFSLYKEYPVSNVKNHALVILAGLIGAYFAWRFWSFDGIIFLIPFIAYAEELLFRGAFQNLIREKYGMWYSLAIVPILYTIFSLSQGFPMFLYILIASVVICVVYKYTKSILVTMAINMILHGFLFLP